MVAGASQRPRVAMALASPFPAPRGTQAWVSELCRGLLGLGWDVHLFCYGQGMGGSVPEGLVLHRAPLLPGVRADLDSAPSLKRPLNDAALLSSLLRELPRLAPRVVHGHNHEGGLAAGIAGRLMKIPVVHQIHGSLSEELHAWTSDALRRRLGANEVEPAHFGRDANGFGAPPNRMARVAPLLARAAGRALDYGVPRLAHHVLTLDDEAAETAGLSREAVTVLPPGVTTPEGRNSDGAAALPGEGPWAVYPGNLDPYQSLGLLEEAWKLVRKENPRAGLALVTHDEASHPLQHLPGVSRIAPRSAEHANDLIASARFVVIPRTGGGGYPLKLLNALGLGVPVVASEPAAKGLTKSEGVLAVPGTARSIAEAMLHLYRDDASRRALVQGAASFAESHSWRDVAGVVADVYRTLS